jgi:hypothetical protein
MKEEYTVQQDGVGAVTGAIVTYVINALCRLSHLGFLLRHSAFLCIRAPKEEGTKETKWHF